MILTVCPNTAIDKIFFVNKWTPGTPMRTNKSTLSVGGKGLDSSVVLSHLNVDTVAMGFFSGSTGQELIDLLVEYGIRVEPVWVDGTNRISYVIVDESTNVHNHVIVGDVEISAAQKAEFFEKFEQRLAGARWAILAGSIPPSLGNDFYFQLIKRAEEKGVKTLVDSQNDFASKAIPAQPDVIKMNKEEFETTFNVQAPSFDDLYAKALEIKTQHGIRNLVLTLSKDGLLVISEEGHFLGKAPVQKAINAAGAGDAVSAAIAWRLSLGDSWAEVVTWASAIGAASVLTQRTGDVQLEDVERIYEQVEVKVLDQQPARLD